MAVQLGYQNVYRDPFGYPEWKARGLPVNTARASGYGTEAPLKAPGPLHGWAMVWTLLGIFAGGIALNLTPCVYPLIPITVSYFGGRKGKTHLIGQGICYIGGLSITNSILGVVAAFTGGLMGALLQNPVVLVAVSLVLLGFATSLFGFWELRLPGGVVQAASKSYSGYFGAFFMGLTLGVIAAPCIGPFVLGLLTWVASMGSPLLGFIAFFTLSLGLGIPLFFLAIFSGSIHKLPRSGEWMIWVRKLMGWVLVGMAAYFIRPLFSKPMDIMMLAAVAVAAGLHLVWIDKTAGSSLFEWIKTGTGVITMVMATLLVGTWVVQGPGVAWKPYSSQILVDAKASGTPVIIDFSANWCKPCRELDEITFHDGEVVKQAEQSFIMIKIDLTRKANPTYQQLLKKYDIKGVPTVLFLDEQGVERRDLRLLDYMPADQFLIRMVEVRNTHVVSNSKTVEDSK